MMLPARQYDRCPTCGDSLVGRGPDCRACERLSARFHKIYEAGQGHGDSDYAMHELAHCVLLLGRCPRNKRCLRAVQKGLDTLPTGRAQIHELRTIRLQHEAQRVAGLASSLRRHLDLTWSGLQDVVHEADRGGALIIKTETHALRIVRAFKPSPRKVHLLAAMYVDLRAG